MMKMMKKIGYWLLLLLLVLSCVPELPVQPVPVDEVYPEGAKATVHFSVSGGCLMPATKALGEKPELDSLYLAVFGSSGYLKEYVKATIERKPTYVGADTIMEFSATLTLSDKERSVHFIGNGPSTLDFGYDTEILPQLLSAGGGQAFWQMKKNVLIEGDKQQDGSYRPTDATNAQFANIPLIRNFSKIVLENQEGSNFTPDSFAVFSVPAKGSVVPFHDGKFVENYQDFGFSELIAQYSGNLPDSTDFMWDAGGWDTLRVEKDQAVYLYERPAPAVQSTQFPPTYVIVHGVYYNPDDQNAEHNNKPYYYKIDLMQDGEYYPILRNFKYKIRINKILSIGHTTAQAAAASAGSADVSADITTSHLSDISDGEARLVVQPWMSQTFNKRQVNNNLLHVKFFSHALSGDPEMSFDAVQCEIQHVDGQEDIIESASIGYPVQASGTEKGWRTVTFTTVEPGAPGTAPRTQALRIKGTYKTANNETRTLYRDVLITLQPLQQFQLIVESPDDTGTGVPRDTAQAVQLKIGIPTGLAQSMFPLNLTIEPEDMSLTPDNQVSNNNLPVSAGTSISDHADYAGKRAFQFIRTLTYDEYLALPQSLDLDGEPIRTVTCHFKTTRKDNATTIWVANDYFSKARVAYANEPAAQRRFFYVEAREDNINKAVVKLSYSTGKLEYQKNSDGWSSYTSNSELRLKPGDRVYFRGNIKDWSGAGKFLVEDGYVNLGGNIASLFRDNFTEDDLPAEDWGADQTGWKFQSFFEEEPYLVDASQLILPMSTMVSSGYLSMFKGCTGLTAAPALPATSLASNCYQSMFENCIALTSAPALPATALATYCYESMFRGCTALQTAPSLRAETLVGNCYANMFNGCTHLKEITMIGKGTIPNTSLAGWVTSVASTGDFYGHVTMTLPEGVNGIPTGWVDRKDFYVEAVEGGTLSYDGSGLAYSRNWEDWTSDGIFSITVAAGDIVRFRGVRNGGTISSTGQFNVAGNILSLASEDYTSVTTGTFVGIFKNAENLVSAANLVLPTTLQANCFKAMFSGCTSLTTPPTLSATTLAANCYEAMFQNCTSLTSSPTLPAETLVDNCYKQMFSGCTKLNYVVLSATGNITANNYTDNWLENVAGSGFMLKSRDLVLSIGDNSGVPTGWNPEAPFFIEAKAATCKVKINKVDVRYNIDGSGWNDYTQNDEVSLSQGQKMFIQATINDWSDKPVTVTGNFAIGGCLASLVKGNYTTTDEAIGATDWKFTEFMSGKTNLVDASYLDLPMLTVGNYGYKNFFNGCSNLVTPPASLPATKLGQEAYSQMFYGCSKLASIPSFPSTSVTWSGKDVCVKMFFRCNALTTLTGQLFSGTMTMGQGCFMDMFSECANLATVPSDYLPATTLAVDCYRGMFQSTALTRAPDLLVEDIANCGNCYRYMFYNCANLTYIKCLARNPWPTPNPVPNTSAPYTQNWVQKVTKNDQNRIFVRNDEMITDWPTSDHGIPSGWTVKKASEE